MIPQSNSSVAYIVRTDRVVVTCIKKASAPDAVKPDTKAYSNIYELLLVSFPITTLAL